MIGVAEALAGTGNRRTMHTNDITLWVAGGSDAYIENQLKAVVTTIEQRLLGLGMVCSPKTYELPVLAGKRRGKTPQHEADRIKIVTASGNASPK